MKPRAIRGMNDILPEVSATWRYLEQVLQDIALNLLGEDGENRWDRVYVVRREAREALEHFRG